MRYEEAQAALANGTTMSTGDVLSTLGDSAQGSAARGEHGGIMPNSDPTVARKVDLG